MLPCAALLFMYLCRMLFLLQQQRKAILETLEHLKQYKYPVWRSESCLRCSSTLVSCLWESCVAHSPSCRWRVSWALQVLNTCGQFCTVVYIKKDCLSSLLMAAHVYQFGNVIGEKWSGACSILLFKLSHYAEDRKIYKRVNMSWPTEKKNYSGLTTLDSCSSKGLFGFHSELCEEEIKELKPSYSFLHFQGSFFPGML